MMSYVSKTVIPPSVVGQACQGYFCSPLEECVVLGHGSWLEVLSASSPDDPPTTSDLSGLRSVFSQPVFGSIRDLKAYPSRERNGLDILLLLSDSGKLSLLLYSAHVHK